MVGPEPPVGSGTVRASILTCDRPRARLTVPDHVDLASREEQEALRRVAGPSGVDAAAPVRADGAAVVGQIVSVPGQGRPRPGLLSGATGVATFMAMQRLAGNRAMVQALSRPSAGGAPAIDETDLSEEKPGAGSAPPDALGLPGQAGAAAGAPGGTGGSAGGGAPGPPGGDAGSNAQPTAAGGGAGAGAGDGTAAGVAGGIVGALAGVGMAPNVGAAVGGAAGSAAAAAGSVAGVAAAVSSAAVAGGAAGAAGGAAAVAGGTAGAAGGAAAPIDRTRRTEPPPITGAGGASAGGPAAGTRPATGAGTSAAGGAGPAPGAGLASAGPSPAALAGPGAGGGGSAAAGGGAGGTSDANTVKTGIDWNGMLSEFGPPARTVLEVGRLIPGWGLLAGYASDALSFASDLNSIPTSKNARFATDLVIFRNFVNIENNALGHVLYVNQLIQDGLAGSVVGAEFTPLTATANEVLSGVKVALDEVQMGTDIVVEVESIYEANHAPTSAEAEQWRQLADSYAANILGDVVNTVLDVISLASAGAANTAPVEEAKLPLTLAGAFLEHAAPNIISAINNILGVWLGSGVTAGRHAATGTPGAGGAGTGPAAAPAGGAASSGGAVPAVQRLGPGEAPGGGGQAGRLRAQALVFDAAGGFVEVEAPQARATYDGINVVIDAFEAYADDQVAQINAVVGALSGGQSAFQVIRDAVKTALDDMNAKVAMAQRLGETATNASTNAASISAACTTALASVDSLVMPQVHIPSVDLGEGVLAEAASAVANTAAEAANAALQLAISGVSAALDTAKDAIRSPILDLKSHADGLGEWLAILATQCTEMVATLHTHIASFSEGLGHCTNVEEVINLVIGQVSDLTGMPRFTVQDMRNTWNSIGPAIDAFAAMAPQLHDRAAALRAQADELDAGTGAGPTFALPPGTPPNAGAGPGIGAQT